MNGIMITDNNQLSEVYENDLCEALKKIKDMEDFISTVKGKLYEEMEERGIVKIDTYRIRITKVPETTKEKFDTKTFKAKYTPADTTNYNIVEVDVQATVKAAAIPVAVVFGICL